MMLLTTVNTGMLNKCILLTLWGLLSFSLWASLVAQW